jgi:hypothetical protein
LITFWSRKTSFRGPIHDVFRDQNVIFVVEPSSASRGVMRRLPLVQVSFAPEGLHPKRPPECRRRFERQQIHRHRHPLTNRSLRPRRVRAPFTATDGRKGGGRRLTVSIPTVSRIHRRERNSVLVGDRARGLLGSVDAHAGLPGVSDSSWALNA